SETYNQELSIRRAEAVRRVLVQRGIPEKRAMAVGLGEAQPGATNATVAGRAKNRRVELRIAMVKEEGEAATRGARTASPSQPSRRGCDDAVGCESAVADRGWAGAQRR